MIFSNLTINVKISLDPDGINIPKITSGYFYDHSTSPTLKLSFIKSQNNEMYWNTSYSDGYYKVSGIYWSTKYLIDGRSSQWIYNTSYFFSISNSSNSIGFSIQKSYETKFCLVQDENWSECGTYVGAKSIKEISQLTNSSSKSSIEIKLVGNVVLQDIDYSFSQQI